MPCVPIGLWHKLQSRKQVDRIAERFPADRDVIGVNLLAIVAYQSLRYGAWHSGLVQKRCRRPAEAVKRKRVNLSPAAVSYSSAAMAPTGWFSPQTSLNQEVAERY
jgi:hypothetical protein